MAVPVLAKAAVMLLTSEKGRKGIGFVLLVIFAPLIVFAAILCSAASGGADHNNLAVEASFYGTSFTEPVPAEFRDHVTEMQTAFSLLDRAVAEANTNMTDGNRLDPLQVKAIFYALCCGEDAPTCAPDPPEPLTHSRYERCKQCNYMAHGFQCDHANGKCMDYICNPTKAALQTAIDCSRERAF